jgi:NADPH:quinone reductase-like Zn-dependent oxidoreductase
LTEIAKPVPCANEVLIQVHAMTVSSADWRVRSLELPTGFGCLGRLAFGLRKPRQPILGTELAGVVDAIGEKVSKFNIGDKVFGFPGARMGAYAEYHCISEHGPVALMPSNLDFAQAAALSFGGSTMLDFFCRAQLKSGERVLINGASGAVGTAAVQLARHLGAHVTGVCSSANLALVRAIGADEVIDYTTHDFTQLDRTFDVIVDTVGNAPFERSQSVLSEQGRLLLVLANLTSMLRAPWINLTSKQKVIAGPVREHNAYLHELSRLAETGAFTPVIDRTFAFEDMRAAHHYVDKGHKRGNVVVLLQQVETIPSRPTSGVSA